MRKARDEAIECGMSRNIDSQCPECGCDWYGNKNLCGEGHKTCFNCHQEYWDDVEYESPCKRVELL